MVTNWMVQFISCKFPKTHYPQVSKISMVWTCMDTVEKMPQSFASVRCHTSLEQHNRHAGIQTCTQTTIPQGNSVKILFWTSQIFQTHKKIFWAFPCISYLTCSLSYTSRTSSTRQIELKEDYCPLYKCVTIGAFGSHVTAIKSLIHLW